MCVSCIVRFEILTALSMKMRDFWHIAPCSLAGVNRRFRRAYYSRETKLRYVPEDLYSYSETFEVVTKITRK
jgi:hypothetical protein